MYYRLPGLRVFLLLLFVVILSACSGGGDDPAVDSTAPIISALNTTPSITTATIQFNSSESGTAYYVVQLGGSSPTAEQVKSSTGNGGSIVDSGNLLVTVGNNVRNIANLTASTTYMVYIVVEDAAGNESVVSNIQIITLAVDNTAPILSADSATPASTSAALQFTSDEAGTTYYLAQEGGSAPSAAQVKSGSGNGGVVAGAGSFAAVSGVNNVNVTGLSPNTAYTLYFIVEDTASNQSLVASVAVTTTAPVDITAPVISAISVTPATTSVALQFTSDEAGTTYYLAQEGGSVPSAAQVTSGSGNGGTVAGAGSSSAVNGVNNVNLTGLSASTAYTLYFIVEDAASNQSVVYSISTTTLTATITSFELVDPTPGAGDGFGGAVVVLSNGNIVVADSGDSSVSTRNGAVHLFNPLTQTLISSFYGDSAYDNFGFVTALPNGNYVISSSADDAGGISNAGSVRLMNGVTGAQIGSAIVGDIQNDGLSSGGITVLPNSNYVISTIYDDENGIVDAGSVRLVNGSTGAQIGSPIAGNTVGHILGSNGVTPLPNSNYVIASQFGVNYAGSVMLVSGATGAQIGSTIEGDNPNDFLGERITALENSNFVIGSPQDDVGGVANVGSTILVNGVTGAQIGSTLSGDIENDQLGFVIALSNNNYVVSSSWDNEGGINNAGSAKLVNGTTGAQIGSTLTGDNAEDMLAYATALSNDNYVIASPADDVGGISNTGSVRLMNGTTGNQIGSIIAGDEAGDGLGIITALKNNNYVIVAAGDNLGGIFDVGSVRLIDGASGAQIGSTIMGDTLSDQLGSTGITALPNGNYVISSAFDDEGGISGVGSVILVNGTTGAQIGSTIAGTVSGDQLGYTRRNSVQTDNVGITALSNSNFVIISEFENVGGVIFQGTVRLINGTTGAQIGSTIEGGATYDMSEGRVVESPNGDFHIISLHLYDNNGRADSGLVRLIAH